MKKAIVLFLILSLLLCACGPASGNPTVETREFTDSTGRTVTLPASITKIAISGPYGWLSSPPAVQRYLGMLWLGELLYPEYAEYDLQEKVTEYYKLFYGCDLTDAMYQELTADSR